LGVGDSSSESRKKLGTIALLYFIQGAPAAILWEVLPVYFRINGVSLRAIGGLRLLELPYSLKVLWSPLVHRFGERRFWVLACMLGIAAVLFALPFVDIAGVGLIVLLLILALTTLSATQDVAIDSYSVGLVDRAEEGAANGVRASAYRVALVAIGGGAVFLAGVLAWNSLFVMAGVVFAALGFVVLTLPRLSLPEEAKEHWLAGFTAWAGTWKVIPLILFVLTYKLGEFAIGPMVKPFWVDYGRTIWPVQEDLMFQIGMFPTTFGIVLSVVGALMGGAFVSRYGIFHAIWFLGLLQAGSNLGYSVVEWLDLGRFGLYGASMFESLSGGLGTAAFLAFLMNVCQKEHATVQYAFLSSVFFSYRQVNRRDQRSGRGEIRFRQLLRDYVLAVDAGVFVIALGETMDPGGSSAAVQASVIYLTLRNKRITAAFATALSLARPARRSIIGTEVSGTTRAREIIFSRQRVPAAV
jgi:PAT family beta-lactamase induction signal transducer AmpG